LCAKKGFDGGVEGQREKELLLVKRALPKINE
jgi:hypothetical protein